MATERHILRLEVSVREYQSRVIRNNRWGAYPAPEEVFGAELYEAGFDPHDINVETLCCPDNRDDLIIFTQEITEGHSLVAVRIASDLRQHLTAAVEEDLDAYSDAVAYLSKS